MISKLLLVEPSASMRYVLENYAQSLGFSVVAIGDYKLAEEALHQQFSSYGDEFSGVLFGWPVVSDSAAESLISKLEGSDFSDLPVIVMSADMRAETRAWVAGREHTAVLSWKDYQSVDDLLQKLLQQPLEDSDTFISKFDNSDINVLVVDDSVSVRYSMRDLFELQGYKVSIASGLDEAIAMAQKTPFDIGILDFYLQGGTGDALCRRLITDPATGQITCAMLTGTYSDHIIKRSLRAGAVECMFKNESSELLLARVDALARFVRQRKYLASQQNQLDVLVDTLAGATVVVDTNDTLSYVSEQACRLLGFDSRASLVGQTASQVLDLGKLRESPPGKYRAQWRDSAQGPINVIYRQILLAENNDIVVNFKRLPAGAKRSVAADDTVTNTASEVDASIENAVTPSPFEESTGDLNLNTVQTQVHDTIPVADSIPILTKTPEPEMLQQSEVVQEEAQEAQSSTVAVNPAVNIAHLPDRCTAFVKVLEDYTTQAEDVSDFVSILMVDLFAAEPGKDFAPTNQYVKLPAILERELKDIYKRENHVVHFGANRYGLILRHATQPQAYLLTRKIMQLCNAIDVDQQVLTINSTGCLYSISSNKGKTAAQILSLADRGLDVVNQRGRNQALLLDLRRMLPVYASQNPNSDA